VGVLGREFVSARAVSFFGVRGGERVTAHQVLAARDDFKVVGVDAGVIPTKVVDLLVRRNLDVPRRFVSEPVGRNASGTVPESPVLAIVRTSKPEPATVSLLHVEQEPLKSRHVVKYNRRVE
jgi:hypothetical protein